jgi:TonB family protein
MNGVFFEVQVESADLKPRIIYHSERTPSMKSIYAIGIRMIALMILVCPPALGQNDSQEKATGKEKPRAVSITLKSGEVIKGILIKLDENSVEYKVNDVVQSRPMQEVSQLRFDESSTSAAKTGSIVPAIDPQTPTAAPDTATGKQVDQPTPAPSSFKRPTILSREIPKYTDKARRNGVQGNVVLNVLFAADGTVTSIRVVSGLPDGLNESAIEAAKKIRFKPAMRNGQPVSFRDDLHFSFHLDRPLPSPRLLLPPHNEAVTTDPRKTTLHWDQVPGARRYRVRVEKEIEKPGNWIFDHETIVTKRYYEFDFTGIEVWRWRVMAVNAFERDGDWSDWRILRFRK